MREKHKAIEECPNDRVVILGVVPPCFTHDDTSQPLSVLRREPICPPIVRRLSYCEDAKRAGWSVRNFLFPFPVLLCLSETFLGRNIFGWSCARFCCAVLAHLRGLARLC